MINYMNIGDKDIKEITLHGRHYADIVYCKELFYKVANAGTLHCKDIILLSQKELDELDFSKLNENDRVYYGTLKIDDAFLDGDIPNVENQSGSDAIVADSDIYPQDV